MNIPVFVSCPSDLNEDQKAVRNFIITELKHLNLEPRTLGRTDYPTKFPLYEVLVVSRHCAGGVILGFTQFETQSGIWKKGTDSEREIVESIRFPTPWNNLETGILFANGLPLLIFREEGIKGGVFDPGATDVYIHEMPKAKANQDELDELREVLLVWQTDVRRNYYCQYRRPHDLG
jgi:hypothetical protein